MTRITALSLLLLTFLNLGITFRIAYCAVRMIFADEQEQGEYKKKMKNGIVFLVISLCTFAIKNIIVSYFG